MSGIYYLGRLAALFWLSLAPFALAANAPDFEKDLKCPLCGADFKQKFEGTGTSFGTRLDFKPLGPTPAPWAIPSCPKCGFVFYQPNVDKDALKKLKPYINSDAFKAKKDYPSYYRLGLIREFLRDNPLSIGDAYIQASWQLDADPAKCKDALQRAYQAFSFGLKTLPPDNPRYVDTLLICGELERRLGLFDAASARFGSVQNIEAARTSAKAQKIIARQLALIAQKDTAPHAIDENLESLVKPKSP